jgi:hypothetical protein
MHTMIRIISWTRRLLSPLLIVALITTNALTLTSSAFNAALSGLLSTTLGVRTVSEALRGTVDKQQRKIARHQARASQGKRATRTFGGRLVSRTKRVAAKSIAAIPAESIPFIGVAVLIADTGYELYAACETVRDLNELYTKLGLEEEVPDDVLNTTCNPPLPDPDQVWSDVTGRIDQWWEELLGAV